MSKGGDIQQQATRPLSPRLAIYRWHLEAVASIAHRASGLALVIAALLYLYVLSGLGGDTAGFESMVAVLQKPASKLVVWLCAIALVYHFANGIRFLCFDAGWGDSRQAMRWTARLVLVTAAVAAVVLAIILW